LLLRASVVERLQEAARQLPDGIRLMFVEGWRPPDVQRSYFENYREPLRRDGIATDDEEWWHWSYGDRYWALTTGAPAAQYGPTT
jgi:D-alanyl-D-alanine dipeptidase